MMATTVKKFGSICGDVNIDLIIDIVLIDTTNIISIVDPFFYNLLPHTVARIEIEDNTVISRFLFSPKICKFQEVSNIAQEGTIYNSNISFDISKPNNLLLDFIQKNQERRFVALVQCANGNCYLIGDKENGLQLLFKRNTASLSVQLELSSWHAAWYLDVEQLDDALVHEFNYDFIYDFTA